MKAIRIAVGLSLLGYAGYLAWDAWPKAPLIVPPVTYEDGSVEYQLIDFGEDRERGTEDDPIWVLRFPKGKHVSNPDLRRTEFDDKNNPSWKYNWDLTIVMSFPDYEHLEYPHGQVESEETLRVSLTAPERSYGSGVYQPAGTGDTTSASSEADFRANVTCRKGPEVAKGVFLLRQPTEAEILATKAALDEKFGDRAPKVSSLRRCKAGSSSRSYYAYFNEAGQVLGTGNCSLQLNSDGYSPCSFFVWVPQKRRAQLGFEIRHLEKFNEIYTHVVTLLTAATDVEKSRNFKE